MPTIPNPGDSEFAFADYDTIEWDTNGIDADNEPETHCAPSRSAILDAHRCAIFEEYLTRIGAEPCIYEEERYIIDGGAYSATRIGIDKADIPKNYRSAVSRKFNQLNRMEFLMCIPRPDWESTDTHGNNHNTFEDYANAKFMEESSYKVHHYGEWLYLFDDQDSTEEVEQVRRIADGLGDRPAICENTRNNLGREVTEAYFAAEGYENITKQIIELHSDFWISSIQALPDDAYDPEWDDAKYEACATSLTEEDYKRTLYYIWSDWSGWLESDEGVFSISHDCSGWSVHDNTESMAEKLGNRLHLDDALQGLWDQSINLGDIEEIQKLNRMLCEVQWQHLFNQFDQTELSEVVSYAKHAIQAQALRYETESAKLNGQARLIPAIQCIAAVDTPAIEKVRVSSLQLGDTVFLSGSHHIVTHAHGQTVDSCVITLAAKDKVGVHGIAGIDWKSISINWNSKVDRLVE